jgi:hypothetical protein
MEGQRRVDKVVGEKWNRRIVVMDEDDVRSAKVKSRTAQPYLSRLFPLKFIQRSVRQGQAAHMRKKYKKG